MKKMIAFMTICFLLAGPVGGLCSAAANNNAISVQNLIEETKSKARIKGMSVAVYSNGIEELYEADNADMLFQIGSMTKAFTALAILYLEDNGMLRLDDTLDTYLPDFHVVYQGQKTPITVYNLMCHQSGFTNSQKLYPGATDDMSLQDYARSIIGMHVALQPGEDFAYSNVNYNLLGAVIEVVSGESYESFMGNDILKPLGLNNTYCGKTGQDTRVCEGTRLAYGFTFPYSLPVITGRVPAGYFYANAADMLRWIKIQLGEADIPQNYQRLIEKSHQQHQALSSGNNFAGWECIEEGVYAHSGGTENYSSWIIIDIRRKIGVCVLADLNAAASVNALCDDIYQVKLGYTPKGFTPDVWRIFDIIFTFITVAGIGMLFLLIKRRKTILRITFILGCLTIMITAAFLIIIPLVFQEKFDIILLKWAPVSMTGGMIVLLSASLLFIIKACIYILNGRAERKNRLLPITQLGQPIEVRKNE